MRERFGIGARELFSEIPVWEQDVLAQSLEDEAKDRQHEELKRKAEEARSKK